MASQPPLIIHHETYNQEIQSPFNSVSVDPKTRMLIEEVGKKWQALQKVKDVREKGRIWNKIVVNIQTSDVASPALKECTKASIQQKWDALLQKYRDIKDKIESTGEKPFRMTEFFKDIDNYLRNDPSIVVPITSDLINGIKRKVLQKDAEDRIKENDIKKQKSTHSEGKKTNMEEIHSSHYK
ncbi:hypothetical protein C1645_827241 [Glomus cerebriforme]|uniref:Myb-like domain-containing protein n=1 Tax=Glomus cerebriforme TaxID=658196 RepID=A0A397SSC3_9GLOM|nr:hypothetical protein C1645_827241 [Glomus cerebriforme]